MSWPIIINGRGADLPPDTRDCIVMPACPDCGAQRGVPCLDPDGTPGAPHPARMEALVEVARNLDEGRGDE